MGFVGPSRQSCDSRVTVGMGTQWTVIDNRLVLVVQDSQHHAVIMEPECSSDTTESVCIVYTGAVEVEL